MSMVAAQQTGMGPGSNGVSLPVSGEAGSLGVAWLKTLCLESGADDVGFVSMERSEIDVDRDDILLAAPWTKTLISFVIRMNRENIRSPMRSLANVEFHASDDQVTETSRKIVRALDGLGEAIFR